MAERAELLMLEDVMALPVDVDECTPIWMEYRIWDGEYAATTRIHASVLWRIETGWWRALNTRWGSWEDRRSSDYNVSWRLWSSLPTDEQREAQPWET